MLYIFRVDTGTMLTLDMNLALETVSQLKDAIERLCRIPAERQVLLVSGGECLDLSARVCTYSAGTDTNPIYLFSKCTNDNRSLSPVHDYGSDSDVTERVEDSLHLAPTLSTVVTRVGLAQTMCDLAKDLVRDCERLVHDQHLQQQGWMAAVANLEDMAHFFFERSQLFEKDYRAHLEVRDESMVALQNFSEDLQTLSRIPILPPLLENAISLSGEDDNVKLTTMTLLQWISAKDNQSTLQSVAEQCSAFLEQLDSSFLDSTVRNVEVALNLANKSDMKEIRGLSERLCGLEQLMMRARRIVQEQVEYAQSFQQNQFRASNLGDASILPDLCASHKRQLLVMLENQTKLKDIRRRCQKAKEELSENLHHRLRWVAYAQNEMLSVGNNLIIYQESLKRGRRHYMIVRQVQKAPEMYCLAVAEVVRRKKFSQAFIKWATDLSNRLLAAYNEEFERRREFKVQFTGHFLEALFPGIEDEPSTFATQPPEPFDFHLPELSIDDIMMLRTTLPDVALGVSWTELSNIAQMFLSKTIMDDNKDGVSVEDRLVEAINKVGLSDKLDETLLQDDVTKLREDRDLESETDSEFEKVSRSSVDKKTDPGRKESDVESLRQHLSEAGRVVTAAAICLRAELEDIKDSNTAERESILELVKQIQTQIVHLTLGYAEELASLQKQYEEDREKSFTNVNVLKETIRVQKDQLSAVQAECETLRLQIDADVQDAILRQEKLSSEHNHQLAQIDEENMKTQELLRKEKRELEDRLRKEIEDLRVESAQSVEDARAHSQQRLEQLALQHSKAVEQMVAQSAELSQQIVMYEQELLELKNKLVQTKITSEMENEKNVKELEEEHQHAIDALEKRLTQEAEDKLQSTTEGLKAEYKAEVDNIRSRFRFMSITSMDKSPSDSSLEKIERADLKHETIIAQAREEAEMEMERAVAAAVEEEREKNKEHLETELKIARQRMEEEKQVWLQEAVTRAVADKERAFKEEFEIRLKAEKETWLPEAESTALREKQHQIDTLMERTQSLTTDCQRYRDTIRLITEGNQVRSGAGSIDPLQWRIEQLENENKELTDRLRDAQENQDVVQETSQTIAKMKMTDSGTCMASSKTDDMTTSVALVSSDVSSSPEFSRARRDKRTRSMRGKSTSTKDICMSTCNPDDPVLVIYNAEYGSYMILQDSPTLHFLHSDCLDKLGLRPSSDGSPRRLYIPATVINKECCMAKKDKNRYGVPKGTTFFHVNVRPMVNNPVESDSLS